MDIKTLDALKISKAAAEAEARQIGGQQARQLIQDEPDYDLLSSLHDSARSWGKGEDGFDTTYIDLGDCSGALNGCRIDGFFEAVIEMHGELMAAVAEEATP